VRLDEEVGRNGWPETGLRPVHAVERGVECGTVVVDEIVVDPEQDRMKIPPIGSRERIPVDALLGQSRKELAAGVVHIPTESVGPCPVEAASPVASELLPEPDRGRAERRMGLSVAEVLLATDRDKRKSPKRSSEEVVQRRNRKGVAIQEDQDIVGVCPLSNEHRHSVEPRCV
jgi:hypothetical protein